MTQCHIICCCYTNNLPLLEQALAHVPLRDVVIIDNSFGHDLSTHPLADEVREVIITPVRLTCSQSFNLMQRIARGYGAEVLYMLHSDVKLSPNSFSRLAAKVEEVRGTNWGVVFTLYDCLCAFNMDACAVVGEWDETIPQYPVDLDYYRRLRDGGFAMIDAGGEGMVHHGSATIRTDVFAGWRDKWTNQHGRDYYTAKWDGDDSPFPFHGQVWDEFTARITASELYKKLAATFRTNEGSIFYYVDGYDGRETQYAQLTLLRNILRAVQPSRILEVGTHKMFFSLFISAMVERFSITTCDPNPASGEAARIFAAAHPNIAVNYRCADSREVLPELNGEYDLCWIDGNHQHEYALSDLSNAMRLGIPHILADDARLEDVERAVRDALSRYPLYYEVANPLWKWDRRGIKYLKLHSRKDG
jgi:predicted O-methyltransferase YrrM